jgi:epoxyqueuosine reductase
VSGRRRHLGPDDIKSKARELGFDRCGIAPVGDHPELRFLPEWLARGYAGTMAYMSRSADRRSDVRRVLPSAQSVIVTATLYNTDRPYSTECTDPQRAQIARYAWGDDYHDVIGERLRQLLGWMQAVSDEPVSGLSYVDTGPVQERVYAQYAGVGWIGKNTCVINPEIGSWILLGEIICSLPLTPDAPSLDQCGTCSLCIEACPTQAIVAPAVLDSTRCISYLTIEHRGAIDDGLRSGIGAHVYGCDVCQEVCPWNSRAPVSEDAAWQPRPAWDAPSLVSLLHLGDEQLQAALAGSAMSRAKAAGLRRNVEIAVQNTQTEPSRTPTEEGRPREP